MTQTKRGAKIAEMPEDYYLLPPKEILEIARQHIGMETEPVEGRYPVEYEPIRRYCHMTGNTNPLHLDPEYARKTEYGEVVCPPTMIAHFSGRGIWPPPQEGPGRGLLPLPPAGAPRRAINLASEWTFYKTVKVGDRISTKNRVADVYMKATRADPEAIWTASDTIFTNQKGEVVAVLQNTGLNYKNPDYKK